VADFPEEKQQELRKLFNQYDKDQNGRIDWDEFCHMLDELTGDKTLQEKSEAFNLIDIDHNGQINFEEFSEWWGKR